MKAVVTECTACLDVVLCLACTSSKSRLKNFVTTRTNDFAYWQYKRTGLPPAAEMMCCTTQMCKTLELIPTSSVDKSAWYSQGHWSVLRMRCEKVCSSSIDYTAMWHLQQLSGAPYALTRHGCTLSQHTRFIQATAAQMRQRRQLCALVVVRL